jgi:hypothetical protein
VSPTKAAPRPRFTKGQVNRAGELLLEIREVLSRDGAEHVVQRFSESEFNEAWEALTWWRMLHARPLSNVAANLRYHVAKEGGIVDDRIAVTQRLKRLPTMIDKVSREEGRITQMHDIGGVRAVLPSLHHVMAVSRRLRKTWTIIKVRDYVAEPKESGYRALHLIVRRQGYPIEVQLRTVAQDAWANAVEQFGRELGLGLKFGAGTPETRSVFVELAAVLARYDWGEISRDEVRTAVDNLRSSLENEPS